MINTRDRLAGLLIVSMTAWSCSGSSSRDGATAGEAGPGFTSLDSGQGLAVDTPPADAPQVDAPAQMDTDTTRAVDAPSLPLADGGSVEALPARPDTARTTDLSLLRPDGAGAADRPLGTDAAAERAGRDTPLLPPVDGGCAGACEPGERRCGTGGLQTCVLQLRDCPDWAAATACPAGTTCSGQAPNAACTCLDLDGDGHGSVTCGGDDCDDGNKNRYPGATEVCDSAGIDEDCNPTTVGMNGDQDGDGYPSKVCCNQVGAGMTCGGDCDDGNPAIHPRARDICGGGDQNCDGVVDDSPDLRFYRDADGDGHGTDVVSIAACVAPAGYVASGGDCDDVSAAIHPGAAEICDGPIDNNCNGTADEGCLCTAGTVDNACGPSSATGACQFGSRTCDANGAWGDCLGAVYPSTELCNGGTGPESDEDCDGTVDEGCLCRNGDTRTCRPTGGTAFGYPSICTETVQVCVNGAWPRDCSTETLQGPVTEVCEGVRDEDCDGQVDDGCTCTVGTSRGCGTNTGECSTGVQSCSTAGWSTCNGVNPVTEICDHLDQDCDGLVDDGVNQNCSWTATAPLSTKLTCFSLACDNYLFPSASDLQLGWMSPVYYPGLQPANQVVGFLPTAVDWAPLGFNVSARAAIRKAGDTALGGGKFGVMISPRKALGTKEEHGLPRLLSGQTGFAAVYDTMGRVLEIYELRYDAAPLKRAGSQLFGCAITTTDRTITVSLEYSVGILTGRASASGCTAASATYTIPSAQNTALVGSGATYPRYYPGVLGIDTTAGTWINLRRIDVERTWGCDGCPW